MEGSISPFLVGVSKGGNMQFIREDIIRSVKENPVFDFLKEEKEFRILIKRLENLQIEERD